MDFWSFFRDVSDENEGFRQFHSAVGRLYENYTHFHPMVLKLELLRCTAERTATICGEKTATGALKVTMRAALLSQIPLNCNSVIKNFYDVALKNEENEENFEGDCPVCLCRERCMCSQYFYQTNRLVIFFYLIFCLRGDTQMTAYAP